MEKNKQATDKVKVPFGKAMQMIMPYAKSRIVEQIKSVSLIVIYLTLFQLIVLKIPVSSAITISLGIGLVVFGLTFFMEGLFLGLMPLGEICGLKLPQKTKLPVILAFSFILGIGATMAEPAIGVLKAAGASVKVWDAPLLFLILNKYSNYLIYAVGTGVGMAVLFGMLRFLYNWSLKPFIFILISVLIGLSIFAYFDPNLIHLTGLAWDCGGVTTGPVTVPLVLALGIGISRAVTAKSGSGAGGGFGVVTLASAFPIIMVLILGFVFSNSAPKPMDENQFFSEDKREQSALLFEDEEAMKAYAFNNASQPAIYSLFDNDKEKLVDYLNKVNTNKKLKTKIFDNDITFKKYIYANAPDEARISILGEDWQEWSVPDQQEPKTKKYGVWEPLKKNGIGALKAILPLAVLLILTTLFILREKLPKADEISLGLLFAVIGMTLFSMGIDFGLSKLGNQVGSNLPSSFKAISLYDQKVTIDNVGDQMIYKAKDYEGNDTSFIYLKNNNEFKQIEFNQEQYNSSKQKYTHIPKKGPIFGSEKSVLGFFVVLLFGFLMGYSATMAEPALNALGITVEELSVGTFKKIMLMQAVAIGVGIGIAVGLSKIIWNIPIIWLLAPPYILLLFLTFISSEEFVNIGWDSAGVTTGPITVPLVLAIGLGIGSEVETIEGFGILSLASVYPILAVLTVGLFVERKRKKVLQATEDQDNS